MADVIAPLNTVTFTIKSVPQRPAQLVTIRRLMGLQPKVQRALRQRAKRRANVENVATPRAGREWINRAKAAKGSRVAVGERFTLTLTPQILPDVKSVERFLEAKKGG